MLIQVDGGIIREMTAEEMEEYEESLKENDYDLLKERITELEELVNILLGVEE